LLVAYANDKGLTLQARQDNLALAYHQPGPAKAGALAWITMKVRSPNKSAALPSASCFFSRLQLLCSCKLMARLIY